MLQLSFLIVDCVFMICIICSYPDEMLPDFERQFQMAAKFLPLLVQNCMNLKYPMNMKGKLMRMRSYNKLLMGSFA